jgi:hypothetical protein
MEGNLSEVIGVAAIVALWITELVFLCGRPNT